jgi:ribosomal protein L3 glutamine methyltransferase
LTLGELVSRAERRLRGARLFYGHGTDNPRDEAAFLVLRGLKLPFDAPLHAPVGAAGRRRVEALLRKRIERRIPAAYLLNEAWLEGRSFYVDRRVIVPRSHIGALLSARLRPWLARPPRRVLDLCTGSGCLAILAALAFPRAQVDAVDLSRDALAVAQINVRRYRLGRRIRLIRSDLLDGIQGERYDVIVTNPPYVPLRTMRALPAEYRHEPGMALAGGAHGLGLISRIVDESPDFLNPRGLLVCEVGDNRRAAERAYSKLALLWPADEVFIWEPSRKAAGPRTRAMRAAAA